MGSNIFDCFLLGRMHEKSLAADLKEKNKKFLGEE